MASSGSRRRRPPTAAEQLEALLLGSLGKKMITAAAVLTAGLYLLGFFKPIVDSGPLPVPSRKEVTDLQADTKNGLDNVNKGLAETLEVAKAANVAAQSANQKLDQSKLDRLIQQKIQLEGLLKMNDDPTLKAALTKTEIDIAGLVSTIQSASGPAQQSLAPRQVVP